MKWYNVINTIYRKHVKLTSELLFSKRSSIQTRNIHWFEHFAPIHRCTRLNIAAILDWIIKFDIQEIQSILILPPIQSLSAMWALRFIEMWALRCAFIYLNTGKVYIPPVNLDLLVCLKKKTLLIECTSNAIDAKAVWSTINFCPSTFEYGTSCFLFSCTIIDIYCVASTLKALNTFHSLCVYTLKIKATYR